MANPGGGNRFASVNLNKSYGQSSHSNRSNNSNYGSGRGRSGGAGGGMVVLSRPRSLHKVGPKLSIPPPLNLPSLRKEHEKFDSLGSGSGSVVAGSGARPSSSGMGWSKPSMTPSVERPLSREGVANGGTTNYSPPSSRSGSTKFNVSAPMPTEKTSVLRGEDFPSLRATITAVNAPVQKQRDSTHVKQSQGTNDSTSDKHREYYHLSSHIDMRPQLQPSQRSVGRGVCHEDHSTVNSHSPDQGPKQGDYFPGPLPLVQLSPRSDWADDERDTGHGFTERGIENGYSTAEPYWEREFDWPRNSFIPHKPGQSHFVRHGQHDNDVGKGFFNKVSNADPFNKNVTAPSREGCEGNSWRMPLSTDGFTSHEAISSVGARSTSKNSKLAKEGNYVQSNSTREDLNGGLIANRDYTAAKQEPGRIQGGRQQWSKSVYPNNSRGATERNRYGTESRRYNVDTVHNSVGLRHLFSAGSKGAASRDDLSFGRDKRSLSRSEKPYVEDPFLNDWGTSSFDGQDPFSGSILGVVKRKKNANEHHDMHDPVRESFEAELERVQKIQEQERQRITEEQEKAIEMARREEEERQRLAREQEEQQRKLEEEAREAAWRAEQEKLDALRIAEEQRIAREEEKQRIIMEEERRKQAAKQKLLELEAKIARRQAEAVKADQGDTMRGEIKDGDASKAGDFSGWEDGERMVERITNTASSDSSSRPFDMGPWRVHEGSVSFTDQLKPLNSWKRDAFENRNSSSYFSANLENGHHSTKDDGSFGGRVFPQKDFYNGAGYRLTRDFHQAEFAESHMNDFFHERGNKWNICGSGDPEAEAHGNVGDKFDGGWGDGQGHGNSPRHFQNPELDDQYTYRRSRYSSRQPQVLPPPSLNRHSSRNESEQAGSSSYEGGNIMFKETLQSEPAPGCYQNEGEGHSSFAAQGESVIDGGLNRNATPCNSQLSLSVSSPPSSPTHLSHDDLDDLRDTPTVSHTVEGLEVSPLENEVVLNAEADKAGILSTASSISVDVDEEWTVEHNEELQEQEEYDDVGFHEENEVREGDDEIVELSQEFRDMYLEEKGSSHTDNMVLGFDQGVEVGIPSDECEESSKIEGSSLPVSHGTCDATENIQDSRDEQYPQNADVIVHKAERTMQDYTPQPINATNTSTSFDSSSKSVECDKQSASSLAGPISVSSSHAQGIAELPVNHQFGLFSDSAPIPVPAIQIGSIQMPLQLQPQCQSGPPLTHHMHAPPPFLFHFGQLSYPCPVSQGIMPFVPPSMSFVQPNVPTGNPSSQGHVSPQIVQPAALDSFVKENILPHTAVMSQEDTGREANMIVVQGNANNVLLCRDQADASIKPVDQARHESAQDVEKIKPSFNAIQKSKPVLSSRASENKKLAGSSSSHPVYSSRDSSAAAVHGQMPGSKGSRHALTSTYPRLLSPANEGLRVDASRFKVRQRPGRQRFEFRAKQSSALPGPNNTRLGTKTNSVAIGSGTTSESGLRNDIQSDKLKQTFNSEASSSGQIVAKEYASAFGEERSVGKETSTSGLDTSVPEGGLKKSIHSEDYVDAPLQSGIVRIFNQPGIEAPSDEDDFIEVRSKRQTLNDRRELREKAMKAKADNMRKSQRNFRSKPQSATTVRSAGRTPVSSRIQAGKSVFAAAPTKLGVARSDVPTSDNVVSQPLRSIGTAINADAKAQTIKIPQSTSSSTSAQGKVVGVHSSVGSWCNSQINQPVMTLAQNQHLEAMKPAVDKPGMVSSPIISKDSLFCSASCPINSLLAGEKIQFGAVTSPTILPSSCVVSNNIRASVSSSLNTPASENGCMHLYLREKQFSGSCPPIEDCEAEAEAAASAVAVAAIASDDMVGNGINIDGSSASVSGPEAFDGVDLNRATAGKPCEGQSVTHSKGEEGLSISLPADLSIENPLISLWPPLPSPHSSSNPMLSPFPGGPTSHFPFYEVNHMMGRPVYAFGPHKELGSAQAQPEMSSNVPNSASHSSTWQQCHTAVDPFYGPPCAGFTAPLISSNTPAGSIPGVQGHHQPVVFYNHFAPVGQVGLGYIGSAFAPEKQPDWKHNASSSSAMDDFNKVKVQQNASNVTSQVQHSAPESSLLSTASSMAMFEVSPFQNSTDPSLHYPWSFVQASSLPPIPQTMAMQLEGEAAGPSQFNSWPADHRPLAADGYTMPMSQTSLSLADGHSLAANANVTVTQFSNEPGLLVPPPASTTSNAENMIRPEGYGNQRNRQPKNYNNYQRVPAQKNVSGIEWSNHRRGRLHGRNNHSSGGDRGFPPSKVKQIYVAKQVNTSETLTAK